MSVLLDERPSGAEGIAPVPPSERRLTTRDLAILWADLGVGVLVLVAGALLVPALGFATAMASIVVGSVIGCALLALGGVAGADHGIPTMVLFRPVLGDRGYRAALLEAGVVEGRLHLAAAALRLGATGLTYYDHEVSRFFVTDLAPLLVTAVGVPAYRARPGGTPRHPVRMRAV